MSTWVQCLQSWSYKVINFRMWLLETESKCVGGGGGESRECSNPESVPQALGFLCHMSFGNSHSFPFCVVYLTQKDSSLNPTSLCSNTNQFLDSVSSPCKTAILNFSVLSCLWVRWCRGSFQSSGGPSVCPSLCWGHPWKWVRITEVLLPTFLWKPSIST